MNMKKVKKSDLDEVKKTIKKEKTDLYPLSNYIEDRIELGKQIFNSLKPKTIKNLAPDFLKNATIEDIQELVSTELLGISTKRLCSIITATKCPSDTESSDSDGRVEEHVSLEEISSDSEDCTRKLQDKKKKRKATVTNSLDNKKNYKEISVLELLELQARARAIRSQLALEPIAKIEVDSDDSTKSHREKSTQSTKKRHSDNPSVETEQKEPNKCFSNGGFSGSSLKRIKLKRNFRKTMECNIPEEGQIAEASKSEENSLAASDKDVKKEKSPSPDVITILPSPETLCISDSSDEESNIPRNKMAPDKKYYSDNVGDEVDKLDKENNESDIEEGEILDKDDEEKIARNVQLEETINTEIKSTNNVEENSNEDHQNDDVISLEHEELDDESKENIDGDCTSTQYTEIKEERNLIVQCSQHENTNISEPIPYIELDGDTSESGNEQEGKEENLHGEVA